MLQAVQKEREKLKNELKADLHYKFDLHLSKSLTRRGF